MVKIKMPKVYCASFDCKYNGDDNRCHAKTIELSDHSVMTMWEGRQQFNKCKTYEQLQEEKELFERLKCLWQKEMTKNNLKKE